MVHEKLPRSLYFKLWIFKVDPLSFMPPVVVIIYFVKFVISLLFLLQIITGAGIPVPMQ